MYEYTERMLASNLPYRDRKSKYVSTFLTKHGGLVMTSNGPSPHSRSLRLGRPAPQPSRRLELQNAHAHTYEDTHMHAHIYEDTHTQVPKKIKSGGGKKGKGTKEGGVREERKRGEKDKKEKRKKEKGKSCTPLFPSPKSVRPWGVYRHRTG